MPKSNVEKTLSAAVLRARLENSTRAQEMNGKEDDARLPLWNYKTSGKNNPRSFQTMHVKNNYTGN